MTGQGARIASARAAASAYAGELVHMEQVARLAGMLFDQLRPLVGLGEAQRELLICAALLHDIGISIDYSGHHKKSRKLIMQAELPALTTREREIVANVARYHRKARPAEKHKAYRALSAPDRGLVCRLAGLLRVADGLDRAHENAVSSLVASPVAPDIWNVTVFGGGDLAYAIWAARRKTGLFEDIFKARLRFENGGPAPAQPVT